jgi:hypothetical protein
MEGVYVRSGGGLLRLPDHFITATLEALLDLSAMRTTPLALHPSAVGAERLQVRV